MAVNQTTARHWLKTVQACVAFDQSMKSYAADQGINIITLYSREKTLVKKHVLLRMRPAIHSTNLHNEWPKLVCYLEDGRLSIDNNQVDNAIRPFAVGRNCPQFVIIESIGHWR